VDGAELARYPFTPQTIDGGVDLTDASARDVDMLGINLMVPYVSGTTRVDIEGTAGAVLKSVRDGLQSPSLHVLTPNGGETVSGASLAVGWTGSDAEGDLLAYSVQYSADGGTTWQMVTQNITTTSVQVPRENLTAGTQALVRVWASDGIHTATDTSDWTFTVTNAMPGVRIVQPQGATTILAGQTLALEAHAYDADDGNLSGDQVQWSSSADGPLGSGDHLAVYGLGVGLHTINVLVSDEQGATAGDAVLVTVLPAPIDIAPATVFLPVLVR
jgi:hypothetical protein